MTSTVTIEAGVCGFRAVAEASCADSQNVTFAVTADCEKIRRLAALLNERGPIDAYAEISPAGTSELLGLGRHPQARCCVGCVVPTGLHRALQVAAGLALPQDIRIKVTGEG